MTKMRKSWEKTWFSVNFGVFRVSSETLICHRPTHVVSMFLHCAHMKMMHFGHFSAYFEVCQEQVMGIRCYFLHISNFLVFWNNSNCTSDMLLVVSVSGETVLRDTKTRRFSMFFAHFGVLQMSPKLLGVFQCNIENMKNTILGPFRTDPKMTTFWPFSRGSRFWHFSTSRKTMLRNMRWGLEIRCTRLQHERTTPELIKNRHFCDNFFVIKKWHPRRTSDLNENTIIAHEVSYWYFV